jgi:eukaryotic-like serine/threonine-protein kinase
MRLKRAGELSAKSIFTEALAIVDPAQRLACLERSCGHDAGLRRRVLALLEAAENSQESPLDGIADVLGTIHDRACVEANALSEELTPLQDVGPYKLLQQIGAGGMGIVYLAEQSWPVKRLVALKLIKPGMDSREVLARFKTEQQALALMDHPNIARVIDAGMIESGRPYFVMEYVQGRVITSYCDQERLGTRERLQLFLQVCRAVQHAHQKGIIHRDLKPRNLLVSMSDSVAVVKVIDFGVAKAIGQSLITVQADSICTGVGQLLGTPLYMSPEQAGCNRQDVDTRSDVYSLGVVLYELLTRTTPIDRTVLSGAGIEEVHRIIREVEPRRPSEQVTVNRESERTNPGL